MKKFVKKYKTLLIIFAIVLVVGIICKVISSMQPDIVFERSNTEALTDERVFDWADKLTDEEEEALREKIRAAEDICGTDIIIVTLDESLEEYAKSYESIIGHVEPYQYTMVYADNFYDEGLFGYDAPHGDGLILVDNWYREADGSVYTWVSTSGRIIQELDQDKIESILDTCLEYVEDDPAYAYGFFVNLVRDYLDPNATVSGTGISIIVGLIAAWFFRMSNRGGKKGSNTVEIKTYVKGGNANIRQQQDIFLTKTMHRRKIETVDSSSDDGSHTSAGGYSHGGGGHSR